MNKFEKIVVALLVVVAIEGALTTALALRIARNGFGVAVEVSEEPEAEKMESMIVPEVDHLRRLIGEGE